MRVADDRKSERLDPTLAGLRTNDVDDTEIDSDGLGDQGRQTGFTRKRQKVSSVLIDNVGHYSLHLLIGCFWIAPFMF
jgi:hypothetical protein